nr:hypothetical protein [uncultured Emticicia sp.]
MLKIIKKFLILGFIIVGLNLLFLCFTKVLFPSKSLQPELDNFISQPNKQSVKYLFVGSSRTYTSMNPDAMSFHLLLPKEKIKILGISSVSFPKLYFILKYIIESANTKQHIFVELSDRNDFFEYHPKFLLDEPYILLKVKLSFLYLLKNFSKRLEFVFNWPSRIRRNPFNWNSSGFYTMEEIATREPSFKDRNKEMLSSTLTELDKYNPLKLNSLKTYEEDTEELSIYVALLIKMAKKKQVDLVFFPPNRLKQQEYDTILPVFLKIPNENKINPNQSPKFSVIMSKDYLWDKGHLNQKGSRIYANIVGEIIAKRNLSIQKKEK